MKIIPTNSFKDVLKHLGVILGSLGVLFIIFFYFFLPFTTEHGETIQVPELKEMNIQEAINLLEEQNLNYEITDCTFIVRKKADLVLTQFPEAGDLVKSNRRIYLTISTSTPPSIKLPNIIGSSIRSAEQQLIINGLILGNVKEVNDPRAKEVLEVYFNGNLIEPETYIKKGSKLDLIIGNGNENLVMQMPDIIGKPYYEAQFILAGLELNIGNITFDPYSNQPKGTIFKAECPNCTNNEVRTGDTIDLWVSGEEE